MFIRIYEAGSFSAAAEKLNYTQSAISQHVSAMENTLGVPLLHRGKKGLSLTTEGERVLPLFYKIYDAETHLYNTLHATTQSITGTIRIGAFPSVSCFLLPHVIQSFKEKYPLVDYQVIHGNYTDVESYVVSGKVDLGFIRCPSAYQLDMFRFQPESLVAIMPASHKLSKNSILDVSDLDKEDFVMLDDGHVNEVISYFEENKIMPKINQKVKGNLALLGFVSVGLGISIVPEPFINMLPESIIWKKIEPSPYRTITIACKDKSKLSYINQLFFREIVSMGKNVIGKNLE